MKNNIEKIPQNDIDEYFRDSQLGAVLLENLGKDMRIEERCLLKMRGAICMELGTVVRCCDNSLSMEFGVAFNSA